MDGDEAATERSSAKVPGTADRIQLNDQEFAWFLRYLGRKFAAPDTLPGAIELPLQTRCPTNHRPGSLGAPFIASVKEYPNVGRKRAM